LCFRDYQGLHRFESTRSWVTGGTAVAPRAREPCRLGLALIIAGEETLETTSVIRAMERYPGMAPESVLRRRRADGPCGAGREAR
jgi:hypothetical protein